MQVEKIVFTDAGGWQGGFPRAMDSPSTLVLVFGSPDCGRTDEALAELGFGRAHHRVLHFVSRNPGIRVADLLDILKITKQSLARVLKQLVDEGYIDQMAGTSDRRERRLYVTFRGESLARELMVLQAKRIASALERAGEKSYHSAESFLYGMISPGERQRVQQLLRGSNPVSSE